MAVRSVLTVKILSKSTLRHYARALATWDKSQSWSWALYATIFCMVTKMPVKKTCFMPLSKLTPNSFLSKSRDLTPLSAHPGSWICQGVRSNVSLSLGLWSSAQKYWSLMKLRQHLTLNLKWKFRPLSRLLQNPAPNSQSWLLLIVSPLSRALKTYFTFSQGPSWFKLPRGRLNMTPSLKNLSPSRMPPVTLKIM
jgi:hypothetical protein